MLVSFSPIATVKMKLLMKRFAFQISGTLSTKAVNAPKENGKMDGNLMLIRIALLKKELEDAKISFLKKN